MRKQIIRTSDQSATKIFINFNRIKENSKIIFHIYLGMLDCKVSEIMKISSLEINREQEIIKK